MNRRRDKPPSTYISAGLEVAVALTGTLFLAGALLATVVGALWWDRSRGL